MSAPIVRYTGRGNYMLNYAMGFLVLGAVVWGAYWVGVPVPIQASWILSSIGILLMLIFLVTGRTTDKVL